MSKASRLAISTTKTDRRAFVTLRFAGDRLDPREISAILPIEPTRANRKGEAFFAGQHAGELRGRTGTWFLATDKLVPTDRLCDHLHFVERLLYPSSNDDSRVRQLRDVLQRAHSRAHVTCYWRGWQREPSPQIPVEFRAAIERLAGDIETDFAITETS